MDTARVRCVDGIDPVRRAAVRRPDCTNVGWSSVEIGYRISCSGSCRNSLYYIPIILHGCTLASIMLTDCQPQIRNTTTENSQLGHKQAAAGGTLMS